MSARRRTGWLVGGVVLVVLLLAGSTYAGMARGGIVVRDDDGCPRTAGFPPSSTAIDWVPLVRVDGTTYVEVSGGPVDRVARDRIGEPVREVRCSYGEAVQTPDYEPRDGEATYLPVGTPVHEVVGVDPAFELVALTAESGPRLYRRDLRPDPSTSGEDVVPLTTEDVTGIALLSEEDGVTELGRVRAADVAGTVAALRAAEVEPPTSRTYEEVFVGPRVFVALERDGLPALTLVVFTEPGVTTDGLAVPADLLARLREVVD